MVYNWPPKNFFGSIVLYGSTSGSITFTAPAVVASYTLVFPAAQGGAGTTLVNDGAGHLSWAIAGDSYKRAANVAISASTASVTVTFSSAEADTTYVPVFSIQNLVDANPVFLQGYISAKTVNGFTVKFNAPTNSANYFLTYFISGVA